MWHDGSSQDTTAEINSLTFNDGGRWKVTFKDLANGGILNERQLDTKANHNSEDQSHDKKLKGSKAPHRAIGIVENENHKNVDQCESTSGDEGYLEEKIKSNSRSDDLSRD